jgi:Asp-tRNA(Asn)/Glu-tRNA(Gln) amidotransferase A subunit family amidase
VGTRLRYSELMVNYVACGGRVGSMHKPPRFKQLHCRHQRGAKFNMLWCCCHRVAAAVHSLLGTDGVLAIPTAPGPAIPIACPPEAVDEFRKSLISLTCIAGLSGCPQVRVPGVLTRHFLDSRPRVALMMNIVVQQWTWMAPHLLRG